MKKVPKKTATCLPQMGRGRASEQRVSNPKKEKIHIRPSGHKSGLAAGVGGMVRDRPTDCFRSPVTKKTN